MNKPKIRWSTNEQIMFFKQLGQLLAGGVAITDSLRSIKNHTNNKRRLILISTILQNTEQGSTLAKSLSLFPYTFNNLTVESIKIAEMTGTLSSTLLGLAVELKQVQTAKKKIVNALIYPIVVLVTSAGVITLLMLYVFPKILPIFASLNAELPFTTRALIVFNSTLRSHGWYVLSVTAILIIIIVFILNHRGFKKVRDKTLLTLPFVGRLLRNYILARFCRSLAHLLHRQVPIMKATAITAAATQHTVYKHQMIALTLALNHGQSLTQFFEKQPKLFPPLLQQLIGVGEKTGTLQENLLFISQLYEEETSEMISNFTTWLEPVMMILLGGIVGFIAISIITPIYQVTQNIHG